METLYTNSVICHLIGNSKLFQLVLVDLYNIPDRFDISIGLILMQIPELVQPYCVRNSHT